MSASDQRAAARQAVDFDHHTPAFVANAHAILTDLRKRDSVAWSPHHDGFWIFSRHNDVYNALRDPETYSSERVEPDKSGLTIPMMPSALQLPLESDGADFQVSRRIVASVLSPTATAALQPSISRWTSFFLSQLANEGGGDLVYDYAMAVPACVTLEWLGLPTEEWRSFSEPLHDAVSTSPDSERFMQAMVGLSELIGRLTEAIESRRTAPTDDVLTLVAMHRVGTGLLETRVALAIIFLLLAGGIDTTTSLTGSALVHLFRDQRQRLLLTDDPALLESAVEEFLRMYPSLKSVARTVTQPVEVRGQQLEAGDRVLLSILSANYDEDAFPDADQMHLDRFPNRHLSFAVGMHRCAGSHLARAMFKEMISQMLAYAPGYQIADGDLREYPDSGVIGGWASIPASCGGVGFSADWAPAWR